ncbi:MAG TPA: glucuronate isomerase [Acidimicrobiales bacterium]|nr:glucuronate isomerase [Acidimicrobiales bacterium]
MLHPHRLFPAEPSARAVAVELYEGVRALPIVSPHGHTEARWFADDTAFSDPLTLLVTPDHYLTRMLYSQGVPLEALGIAPGDGGPAARPREAWRTFASHYHLFRATPSGLWLDTVLATVFDVETRLEAATADEIYDRVAEGLTTPALRPRALLERFGVEFLATTEGALDDLGAHARLAAEGYGGRVVTTFRPDDVVDPDRAGFGRRLERLGELTGGDTASWDGYLEALRRRRLHFRDHGAVATDHGHPSAGTADLSPARCQRLLDRARAGTLDAVEGELFRGQLLLEMARMSIDDGLVMQLHPGSRRNHNTALFDRFGPDRGADIPGPVQYTDALKPLLDAVGNDRGLRLVLFTLDESTFSRELAPLAGHYPSLVLGSPWWFLDSYEAMLRYRRSVTETAGFANTAGFTDDTRALLSIPARHDMARRVDCAYLAELVTTHRLDLDDAHAVAADLAVHLARRTYRLPLADGG